MPRIPKEKKWTLGEMYVSLGGTTPRLYINKGVGLLSASQDSQTLARAILPQVSRPNRKLYRQHDMVPGCDWFDARKSRRPSKTNHASQHMNTLQT